MAEEFKDTDLTAAEAEGSQEEDSDDSEREGRFHGPDASWKFYTKAERELAASLDQIENNDLSAHLYNTHCLKQRSYNSLSVLPWQSKQRWIDRENSAPGLFLPDAHWTAWPLKAAEVPRTGEAWGVAIPDDTLETYRYEESWLPGSQLRDCLQAEIQRQLKSDCGFAHFLPWTLILSQVAKSLLKHRKPTATARRPMRHHLHRRLHRENLVMVRSRKTVMPPIRTSLLEPFHQSTMSLPPTSHGLQLVILCHSSMQYSRDFTKAVWVMQEKVLVHVLDPPQACRLLLQEQIRKLAMPRSARLPSLRVVAAQRDFIVVVKI